MSTTKKTDPKKQEKKAEGSQALQAVKGMPDILPKEEGWWKSFRAAGATVAELHDFHRIETPILEPAELFERGVGAATDIVEKQMYAFRTKGGERVALRPEGTAAVMRAYFEHHLGYFASPLKAFYEGPMFRYERPQAGRDRQFHQWGFEIVGDGDSVYDVEVMLATLAIFRELKFPAFTVKINSMGCKVCRASYREKLKNYYRAREKKLCKDCARRLDKNPFRLLDCEEEDCKALRGEAPIILDYLCQTCNAHFKSVLELVEENGIPYEPDPFLVRGLDYYNRTVFEVWGVGAPHALAGGGRYDYLGELIAGRAVPAVGAAIGMERSIAFLKSATPPVALSKERPRVFFTAVGDQAKRASLKRMEELRRAGVPVVEALGKRSLKGQLKVAGKLKVPLALIFGQKEMFEGSIIMRDMVTGAQETVLLDRLVEAVKQDLKKKS
ncbi:MAG: histidine--tRNA ligase [Candidatus Brennerbacteria bacterium]|nr:histidine--tRNA ligase [Candidatus Brennerbacteria bacterium]